MSSASLPTEAGYAEGDEQVLQPGRKLTVALTLAAAFALSCAGVIQPLLAAPAVLPQDIWTPDVMDRIRDRSTLNLDMVPGRGYVEVFFDSEPGDAQWAESDPPYTVHTGDTIRIHGYLARPLSGGSSPAIVIGHGHGGKGDPDLALGLASFGYVALSIDGPSAGESTGGPLDDEQGWISVEETPNVPAPQTSYLYHYATAGMRALTALDELSRLPGNPFGIDRDAFGIIGASMGGQFTYYINGVDDRVKGAIAIAVAGDWKRLLSYRGSWLYHGLYYYTRDGLPSGQDALNTVSDICLDPTLQTFFDSFDPIQYAPTQHGPLLTIIGTHDQYFTLPAINSTYDRTDSAGTSANFVKRILLIPNGKHGVLDGDAQSEMIATLTDDINRWFGYCFAGGGAPPETPIVDMTVNGNRMLFRVSAPPGDASIGRVDLHYATRVNTVPEKACDFGTIHLVPDGADYVASLRIGKKPPCGKRATPENIIYFATARDEAGYAVSSAFYRGVGQMGFCSNFAPKIEHWGRDNFPLPPPAADGVHLPLDA